MSERDPAWLPQVRELCRNRGINVAGWGEESLVVCAGSLDRAKQIASDLAQLGFQPVKDEDDDRAGLLTLSRNPAATETRQRDGQPAFSDFSRRPVVDRAAPAFEALVSGVCFWLSATQPAPKSWTFSVLGSILLLMFLWDGCRVWGWKLQMSHQELRIRRYFVWRAIPWSQIRAVEVSAAGGRNQEAVTLTLTPKAFLRLGTFGYPFARALRAYLRKEIAQRKGDSE